jgi:hypothetical protein
MTHNTFLKTCVNDDGNGTTTNLRSEGLQSLTVELITPTGTMIVPLLRDTLVRSLLYQDKENSVVLITPPADQSYTDIMPMNRRSVEDFLVFSKQAFALQY